MTKWQASRFYIHAIDKETAACSTGAEKLFSIIIYSTVYTVSSICISTLLKYSFTQVEFLRET